MLCTRVAAFQSTCVTAAPAFNCASASAHPSHARSPLPQFSMGGCVPLPTVRSHTPTDLLTLSASYQPRHCSQLPMWGPHAQNPAPPASHPRLEGHVPPHGRNRSSAAPPEHKRCLRQHAPPAFGRGHVGPLSAAAVAECYGGCHPLSKGAPWAALSEH